MYADENDKTNPARADDILTYNWDFGDGETASGTLTPTHAYGDNGAYTVTLTVKDARALLEIKKKQMQKMDLFKQQI